MMPTAGFVNAHTHLELGALYEKIPEGLEFSEWIIELVRLKRNLNERDIQEAIESAIAFLYEIGTMAIGDISSTGQSVEPLLESGLAGIVYYEVLGMDSAAARERLLQAQHHIDRWRRKEGRMRVGLSIHAPYSSAPELFTTAAEWCIAEGVPLGIHIAESPAEVAFLLSGTGPFLTLNQRFYADFCWQPPGCSPIQYLERLGVLEARPLLFHGVQVGDEDLQLLARHGCAVVHCPRSNSRLLVGRMPLERYLEHGIVVALGTDSLASSPSLDVRDEVAAALLLHGANVPESVLWEMATTGGLQALGLH